MIACKEKSHKPNWFVSVRKANYSTFNGGKRTASRFSEVHCGQCGAVWRTDAAYVDKLPNGTA